MWTPAIIHSVQQPTLKMRYEEAETRGSDVLLKFKVNAHANGKFRAQDVVKVGVRGPVRDGTPRLKAFRHTGNRCHFDDID